MRHDVENIYLQTLPIILLRISRHLQILMGNENLFMNGFVKNSIYVGRTMMILS